MARHTLLLAAALQLGAAAAWAQAPSPGPVTDERGVKRRPAELQADPMKAFDINHDRSIDSAEAKSAAAAHYDGLDPALNDHLTPQQAAPVLSAQEFRKADTHNNGYLTKAEYLAVVLQRFKVADTDKDGKLTQKELNAKAGQLLLKLMR